LTLNIVDRRIEKLKPNPANPRRHTKKQIRQIADSIETFGFIVPILVDREGNIATGHCRYYACLLLGITVVPTLCLDHLTPEQVRAFMIADNRLTEISTWDERLLAEQLKELSVHGLDFNIEVTGFEMGEIDLRIASLDEAPERDDDPADVVPEVADGPAVSKLGDVWLLGGHRVLCGNALEATAFAALMGEERAAMVLTDPPYNVPISRVY
jgi:ParB-like chromosome segregation protein Spo0J